MQQSPGTQPPPEERATEDKITAFIPASYTYLEQTENRGKLKAHDQVRLNGNSAIWLKISMHYITSEYT